MKVTFCLNEFTKEQIKTIYKFAKYNFLENEYEFNSHGNNFITLIGPDYILDNIHHYYYFKAIDLLFSTMENSIKNNISAYINFHQSIVFNSFDEIKICY